MQGEPRHFASAVSYEGKKFELYLDPKGCSPATQHIGAGSGLVHISGYTIDANAQRVENWPRIVACIRRLLVGVSSVVERRILLEL